MEHMERCFQWISCDGKIYASVGISQSETIVQLDLTGWHRTELMWQGLMVLAKSGAIKGVHPDSWP